MDGQKTSYCIPMDTTTPLSLNIVPEQRILLYSPGSHHDVQHTTTAPCTRQTRTRVVIATACVNTGPGPVAIETVVPTNPQSHTVTPHTSSWQGQHPHSLPPFTYKQPNLSLPTPSIHTLSHTYDIIGLYRGHTVHTALPQ